MGRGVPPSGDSRARTCVAAAEEFLDPNCAPRRAMRRAVVSTCSPRNICGHLAFTHSVDRAMTKPADRREQRMLGAAAALSSLQPRAGSRRGARPRPTIERLTCRRRASARARAAARAAARRKQIAYPRHPRGAAYRRAVSSSAQSSADSGRRKRRAATKPVWQSNSGEHLRRAPSATVGARGAAERSRRRCVHDYVKRMRDVQLRLTERALF